MSHSLQKVMAAFHFLDSGEAYDCGDEYVRLSRLTTAMYTKNLCDLKVAKYIATQLLPPNDKELAHMLDRNAERGMPGCTGSIDVSHW